MIDTNSRISQNSLQNTGTVQNRTVNVSESVVATTQQTTSSTQISTLSQQLSEAQTRADARDSSLDREALAAKASAIRGQLSGSSYQQNKSKYDAEVPNTNDPAHLERAKQATEYTNGRGSNPFKGFAPEQLTLIIYDESGTFTTNEKRAALSEQGDQEYAWRAAVVAELNRQWEENNGDISEGLQSIMDHFEGLPAIEEAQYDKSWKQSLQNNIDHFSNKRSDSAPNENYLDGLMSIINKNI